MDRSVAGFWSNRIITLACAAFIRVLERWPRYSTGIFEHYGHAVGKFAVAHLSEPADHVLPFGHCQRLPSIPRLSLRRPERYLPTIGIQLVLITDILPVLRYSGLRLSGSLRP
jgi:hypothetical protein